MSSVSVSCLLLEARVFFPRAGAAHQRRPGWAQRVSLTTGKRPLKARGFLRSGALTRAFPRTWRFRTLTTAHSDRTSTDSRQLPPEGPLGPQQTQKASWGAIPALGGGAGWHCTPEGCRGRTAGVGRLCERCGEPRGVAGGQAAAAGVWGTRGAGAGSFRGFLVNLQQRGVNKCAVNPQWEW